MYDISNQPGDQANLAPISIPDAEIVEAAS
jgi:hypothetical protein